MKLSDNQIKMLEGFMCPYCKTDSKVVIENGVRKMACPKCGAYRLDYEDGSFLGRLASEALWKIRGGIDLEIRRLSVKTGKNVKEIWREIAVYAHIPEEYCSSEYIGEKSVPDIMGFLQMKLGDTGLRHVKTDRCPHHLTAIRPESSACRGCPHFLFVDPASGVWCDNYIHYHMISQK